MARLANLIAQPPPIAPTSSPPPPLSASATRDSTKARALMFAKNPRAREALPVKSPFSRLGSRNILRSMGLVDGLGWVDGEIGPQGCPAGEKVSEGRGGMEG